MPDDWQSKVLCLFKHILPDRIHCSYFVDLFSVQSCRFRGDCCFFSLRKCVHSLIPLSVSCWSLLALSVALLQKQTTGMCRLTYTTITRVHNLPAGNLRLIVARGSLFDTRPYFLSLFPGATELGCGEYSTVWISGGLSPYKLSFSLCSSKTDASLWLIF